MSAQMLLSVPRLVKQKTRAGSLQSKPFPSGERKGCQCSFFFSVAFWGLTFHSWRRTWVGLLGSQTIKMPNSCSQLIADGRRLGVNDQRLSGALRQTCLSFAIIVNKNSCSTGSTGLCPSFHKEIPLCSMGFVPKKVLQNCSLYECIQDVWHVENGDKGVVRVQGGPVPMDLISAVSIIHRLGKASLSSFILTLGL